MTSNGVWHLTTVWIQTVEQYAYLFICIILHKYMNLLVLVLWIFGRGPKEETLTHRYRQNCWMCSRFVDLLGPLLLCLEIRQLWLGVILWMAEIPVQWKRGCRMLWSFLRKSPLWLCQKCHLEIDPVASRSALKNGVRKLAVTSHRWHFAVSFWRRRGSWLLRHGNLGKKLACGHTCSSQCHAGKSGVQIFIMALDSLFNFP